MRVRMVTLAANPDGILTPGTIIDIDDAMAAAMIAAGSAVAIDAPPAPPVPLSVIPEHDRQTAIDVKAQANKRKRSK